MKVFKLLLPALALFVYTSVSAQKCPFRFGVNAGVNLSNAMNGSADKSGSSFRAGYQVGITVDYAISQEFNILSGLSFITKGSRIDNLDYTSYVGGRPDFTHKFEQQYIQLPLYGAYKINFTDDFNLMFSVGPYFAYGVGGESREILHNSVYHDGTTERKFKTFGKNDDWYVDRLKRFDCGLGTLVTLECKKINLNMGYEQGLMDIAKSSSYKYRNYSLTFSAGYKF